LFALFACILFFLYFACLWLVGTAGVAEKEGRSWIRTKEKRGREAARGKISVIQQASWSRRDTWSSLTPFFFFPRAPKLFRVVQDKLGRRLAHDIIAAVSFLFCWRLAYVLYPRRGDFELTTAADQWVGLYAMGVSVLQVFM
jgi:hypothetical protein